VEYRVVRPGGEVRIIYSRGEVTWDESGQPRRMFGMMQDITERKRTEQRLIAEHSVARILAEVVTVEEATLQILQALCECLGWDLGTLWRIDQEAGVLRCAQMWRKPSVEATHFEAVTRASTFRPGSGLPGQVWASRAPACIPDVAHDPTFLRASIAAREGLHAAFAFPILLGSEVLGVIDVVSREIRQPDQDLLDMMASVGSQIGQFIERKRAEESLRQAQAELAHVARLTTLGELTASIAHEINQPLGAMVNSANACVRWLAAQNLEKARQSALRIVADGQRAGDIITGIRALAQKAPPHKDWLDVNETIQEVIALARSEIQRNGVALATQLSEHVPVVLADRIQLQQVILNLMMNAIEAMRGVSAGPRVLEVSSECGAATEVVIAVRDSGPGFAPQHLDRLFDAFYTTKAHGLGLGLAISRRIIEAHGGRLWATANTPHGAVVQFTVPIGSEGEHDGHRGPGLRRR
jgi:signal transduction histidine kinase